MQLLVPLDTLLLVAALARPALGGGSSVTKLELSPEPMARMRREVGRLKREEEMICKYKKGEWSKCEPLTQLVTRQDSIKTKSSSPDCQATRTLTKQCQKGDNSNLGLRVVCVFEKAKSVAWSECQGGGVRQKVLQLVSKTGEGTCPRQKLLSRKCKDRKAATDKKKRIVKNKGKEVDIPVTTELQGSQLEGGD